MFFEVAPSQISLIDDARLFVRLMRMLILAEARQSFIPLRGILVPDQIDVPDGGEDARIEWNGKPEQTDYLPSSFCFFQSKASKAITPDKFKKEMWKKGTGTKSKKPVLSDALIELLDKGGSYIGFIRRPVVGQDLKKYVKSVEAGIKEAGGNPKKLKSIEIYDANRISDWVNCHPSVALWVNEQLGQKSTKGFQTYTAWGKERGITETKWVESDRQISLGKELQIKSADGGKIELRSQITFPEAVQLLIDRFNCHQKAVRISGASGYGKTRLTHNLVKEAQSRSAAGIAGTVLYCPYPDSNDGVTDAALRLAETGYHAILVIDDCPDDVHHRLKEIIQRDGSKLNLITINTETQCITDDEVLSLRLEPAPEKVITDIANQIIDPQGSDLGFIKELSGGFPRMAVAAAKAIKSNNQPVKSIAELMDRIIWGKSLKDIQALKALEYSSLFEFIGFQDSRVHEIEYVAKLADMPVQDFRRYLKRFKDRGIIYSYGDYIQVQPLPLVINLALACLENGQDNLPQEIFNSAPGTLKIRFLERLKWLDNSDVAKRYVDRMLLPNVLGNYNQLNSEFGSKCLDTFVHVAPDHVMNVLVKIFSNLSDEDIQNFQSGRRYLIWALEKLAFRKETFDAAARLLLRFATNETESISNNATGQFKDFYHLHLSGTEAAPDLRLKVLDDGLKSENLKARELCVEAAGEMLRNGNYSRVGGNERIGSQNRMYDWKPATYGEIYNFFRSGLVRLTDIACAGTPLAPKARSLIALNLRGILLPNLMEDIQISLGRIIEKTGFWSEALVSINHWLYFDTKRSSDDFSNQVRKLYDELLPTKFIDKVTLYTQGWGSDLNDPDKPHDPKSDKVDYEFSTRQAQLLAEEAANNADLITLSLETLISSDYKSVFPFAMRLGQRYSDPVSLFRQAADIAKKVANPNLDVLRGIIIAADQKDPLLRQECISYILSLPELERYALPLINSGKLQQNDLKLITNLVRADIVPPQFCQTLAYGRQLDEFTSEDLDPLFDELSAKGPDGLWAILEIIHFARYDDEKLPPSWVDKIKSIITNDILFDARNKRNMEPYRYAECFSLLMKNDVVDESFARKYIRFLLALCCPQSFSDRVPYEFSEYIKKIISSLLTGHRKAVLSEIALLVTTYDDVQMHFFGDLMEPDDNNATDGGLLFDAISNDYDDWIKGDPKKIAMVADWIPLTRTTADGAKEWHPAAVLFIEKYGSDQELLVRLRYRMRPNGWSGSLVPYLKPYLPLLEQFFSHSNPVIAAWARQSHDQLSKQIYEESKRDEEMSAGLRA